jgi:integrase/recombinase XerD
MTDVRKMLGACVTGREAALVALCGLLGLRVAEALGVRVVDFDFAERTLTVRGGKGDKDRTIPVHDEAWSPIFRGIDEQPINSEPLIRTGNRNARRLLTEIGARCGVKVASHDLRSTVLTEMYRVSKDLRAVQEFAGHASSSTTEAYTGIRMKDMRDAIGAI